MRTLTSMLFVAAACAAALSLGSLAVTADAASGTSPFAGQYVSTGEVPGYSAITISNDGSIDGGFISLSFTGHVSDRGRMKCSGVRLAVSPEGFLDWVNFRFDATVSVDAGGDIVGTTTDGKTIFWDRQ